MSKKPAVNELAMLLQEGVIHPQLGIVVTMSEACLMWGKSRTAMINQVMRGRIKARRSITGGEWLLLVTSIINVYGNPKEMTLWQTNL